MILIPANSQGKTIRYSAKLLHSHERSTRLRAMTHQKERNRTVSLQVPESLLDRIDAEARAEGLSRSDVLRRAFMRHVAGQTVSALPIIVSSQSQS